MKNSTGISFVYIALVLGQPIGLPRKVCLYAGADWLTFICHSEGGGKSVLLLDGLLVKKIKTAMAFALYTYTGTWTADRLVYGGVSANANTDWLKLFCHSEGSGRSILLLDALLVMF